MNIKPETFLVETKKALQILEREVEAKMREIYQIEKVDEPREYEAVEEQPPGKQM